MRGLHEERFGRSASLTLDLRDKEGIRQQGLASQPAQTQCNWSGSSGIMLRLTESSRQPRSWFLRMRDMPMLLIFTWKA